MASILEEIQKRKLKWYGHLNTMSIERKTKQVYETLAEGKRRRGRLREEWNQFIGERASDRGVKLKTLKNGVGQRSAQELDK